MNASQRRLVIGMQCVVIHMEVLYVLVNLDTSVTDTSVLVSSYISSSASDRPHQSQICEVC